MNARRTVCAFLVAAIGAAPMVFAASAGAVASAADVVAVDTRAYPDVEVVLSAPEGTTNFAVTEAGKARPSTVAPIAAESVEIVLVIDTSQSMKGEPLVRAKSAAADFVRSQRAGTKLAVVSFGRQAVVASPLSSDPASHLRAIAALQARGETALYDGIVTAAGLFTSGAGAFHGVVVLSDGGNTTGTATPGSALDALRRAHANVTAIALVTKEHDPAALGALATGTGGRMVEAADTAALAVLYAEAAKRLSSQYRLVYRSTHGGSTDVVVSARSNGEATSTQLTLVFPATVAIAGPRARVVEPTTVHPGLIAGTAGLAFGGLAVFTALLVILVLTLAPRLAESRLAVGVGPAGGGPRRPPLESIVASASSVADRLLELRGRRGVVNRALERAGLALRPEEFVTGVAGVALVLGGATWWLRHSMLLGLLGAGVVPLLAKVVVSNLTTRRQAAFDDQLGDTFQLLAGSLRSGYGLVQAIENLAREAESPTAEEFRRVTTEVRLGRDLTDSLSAMADRVGGTDLAWVVQAVDIHREVGGNLAEVLDNVSGTMRERHRMRRQVKALSAEGRMSAYVLLGLPIAMGVLMAVINPSYSAELTGTSAGRKLLLVGVVLMSAGALWLRKIIRPEF